MHLNFKGYSTQYISNYWPAKIKSGFELIFIYVDDRYKEFNTSVNMTKNESSVNQRLINLGWSNFKSTEESKFVLQNWDKTSRIFILNNDQYQVMRKNLINGIKEFELDMSGNQLTNVALPAPGKPVFIVWNMSTNAFVGTAPTKADALTAAQELSRKNPIHTFLICEPTTKIFQPANVTVEAVTLD